jgi:general secretion pathway protein J
MTVSRGGIIASRGGIRAPGNRMTGFTLFEMVIAVSIFALMGVIGFGALGQMTRTGQAVTDANDRLSDMQFAVVYFNRDWIQVSPRKIRNQYGDEESNIIIDDNSITFTRSGWSNLLGHKRSTLQRVQYLVIEEQLVRRHWASLDQGIAEQPIQVVLLDDVESMEVELQNSSGRAIRDWPAAEGTNNGSPVLLAFRLELPDMGEITRLLEIPKGAL